MEHLLERIIFISAGVGMVCIIITVTIGCLYICWNLIRDIIDDL